MQRFGLAILVPINEAPWVDLVERETTIPVPALAGVQIINSSISLSGCLKESKQEVIRRSKNPVKKMIQDFWGTPILRPDLLHHKNEVLHYTFCPQLVLLCCVNGNFLTILMSCKTLKIVEMWKKFPNERKFHDSMKRCVCTHVHLHNI